MHGFIAYFKDNSFPSSLFPVEYGDFLDCEVLIIGDEPRNGLNDFFFPKDDFPQNNFNLYGRIINANINDNTGVKTITIDVKYWYLPGPVARKPFPIYSHFTFAKVFDYKLSYFFSKLFEICRL